MNKNQLGVLASACIAAGVSMGTVGCASDGADAGSTAAGASSASAPPSRPLGGPNLTSGLRIPAGERFIFAGGQASGFTAYATNVGTVPVRIVGELDGVRTEIATIQPGERASHRFAAREAALFENPSGQEASTKVEIWGDVDVGMRYTKIEAE